MINADEILVIFSRPLKSTGDCSKAEKNETLLVREEPDNLSMLYTIVSGALVFIGLSILIQWKLNSKPIRKVENSKDEKVAEITLNRDEMILAGMLFIFMISIVGAEVTYTQFLFTYAQVRLISSFVRGHCIQNYRSQGNYLQRFYRKR